jgi:hypothetical protein
MQKLVSMSVLIVFLTVLHSVAFADMIYNQAFIGYFEYNHQLAQKKGLPTLVDLANYCQQAGRAKHARLLWKEVLTLKKDYPPAHEFLGRVKIGKEWMMPSERDAAAVKANEGKKQWGGEFIERALLEQRRKEMMEAEKLDFPPFYHKSAGVELILSDLSPDEGWTDSRLVESILTVFDRDFDSLGKPKGSIRIIMFPSLQSLERTWGEKTGRKAPSKCYYDEGSSTVLCVYDSEAMIRATIIGRLATLGVDIAKAQPWAFEALVAYFELARDESDRITPGFVAEKGRDVIMSAVEGDLTFDAARLTELIRCKPEDFEMDLAKNRASAWSLLYLCQHEYQGFWRKEFGRFLRTALAGKANYDALKKMNHWNLLFGQMKELTRQIPVGLN